MLEYINTSVRKDHQVILVLCTKTRWMYCSLFCWPHPLRSHHHYTWTRALQPDATKKCAAKAAGVQLAVHLHFRAIGGVVS